MFNKTLQGNKFLTEERLVFPHRQVITRDNIREISRLLESNSDFSVILSNLFFSANNPFQSNFAFISDMSYTEKVTARIQNDYEPTGSLTYIFNRKYL